MLKSSTSFTYFLTDCGKIDDRLKSNLACVWTTDAARWILSEFKQNSFNAWSSRILRLETRPGNGRSISPIFIESLFFIILNRLSFWRQIGFNKSVFCATEKMRCVKRHSWESSFGTLCFLSWYLDWNLRDQVPLWIFLASSLPRYIPDQHCVWKKPETHKSSSQWTQLVQQNFPSNDWFCRDHRVLTSTLRQHWEERIVRHWEKWLLQQCTCTMSSSSWMNRCASLRLQTLFFVASWPQNPWKFWQTLHGMVLLVELVKEREPQSV